MSTRPRRSRVITVALVLSVVCHVALLSWLALTPGAAFQPRTLDVVLVAKSDESRVAAPTESPPQTVTTTPAETSPPPAQTAPAAITETSSVATTIAPQPAPAPAMEVARPSASAAPEPEIEERVAVGSTPAPQAPTDSAQETVTAGLRLAIRQRLAEFLNYPPAARRRAIEGDPVVRFIISRDGSLLDYELARSSGSRHLDRAALQLVRDAAPYPGFPPSLDLAQLEVQLPIEYRLTRLPRT